MKDKELLRRLNELEKLKSRVKRLIQEAFDAIHEFETTLSILIEDLSRRKK